MLKDGSVDEAVEVAKQVIQVINPNLGDSEKVIGEVRGSLQAHLDLEFHKVFPAIATKIIRDDQEALSLLDSFVQKGADINWRNPQETSQSIVHLAARSMKMASNITLIDALVKAGGDFSLLVPLEPCRSTRFMFNISGRRRIQRIFHDGCVQ